MTTEKEQINTIKRRLQFLGWTSQQTEMASLDILGVTKTLDASEEIEQAVRGKINGTKGILLATDRRLVFVNHGLIRMQSESFQYERISSVQIANGFVWSQLFLTIDSLKLTIDGIEKAVIGPFAAHLRHRINGGDVSPPVSETAPADLASQLERLAALREKGILSDAEFQDQKRKLLG
ncbi:PH domain-containing protein [Kouleothrix sp.]|uniref:PH domain-containing protein n=1 Tax=Kouleothrix sp. TaxID=2779161 RepID=UPI00391AFB35